jgi:hypothetical protein
VREARTLHRLSAADDHVDNENTVEYYMKNLLNKNVI